MSNCIRKRLHVSLSKKDTIKNHLLKNNFKENIDFSFETGIDEHMIILTLNNINFTDKIFNVYEEIQEKCFLIRLAMNRWQARYDVCETFWGTIAEYNKYLSDNFDFNVYKINHSTC